MKSFSGQLGVAGLCYAVRTLGLQELQAHPEIPIPLICPRDGGRTEEMGNFNGSCSELPQIAIDCGFTKWKF